MGPGDRKGKLIVPLLARPQYPRLSPQRPNGAQASSPARGFGYAERVRLSPLFFCLLCTGLSSAPLGRAAAQAPVLHEYLPDVRSDEVQVLSPSARTRVAVATASDDGAPGDDNDDEPGTGAERDGRQPLSSQPAAARSAVRSAESFRPDRLTSLEGSLDYYETFNPSIAPFKRVTAFSAIKLDADGKTPVLALGDMKRRVVPIEGEQTAPPDRRPRDRFVGEMDFDFRANALHALPSVSPESRMLALTTTPRVNVQVERDGGDNFFLRARGPIPDRPVHVRWETDAPRAYFGAEIPSVKLRELPKLPPLERSIQRRAQQFAAKLGIGAGSDLHTALEKLTAHFRNFVESAEPPENTGDMYMDLVQGGKGLCRHRAYGFVVTARALRIEARFVQNEAHSWVEVRLPDSGFLRIDLGGATHGLTAHDTRGNRSYIPAQPDTLPRPAAYRQSRARAARDAAATAESAPRPQPGVDDVAGRWLPEPSEDAPPTRAAAGSGKPNAPARATPAKRPLQLVLDEGRVNALRGGKLVVTGRATEDSVHGVPGLRVEVWILRKERNERMLLAVQVSDAEGYFRADFGVPHDLAVGDYRLVVHSDGDAEHQPATSN